MVCRALSVNGGCIGDLSGRLGCLNVLAAFRDTAGNEMISWEACRVDARLAGSCPNARQLTLAAWGARQGGLRCCGHTRRLIRILSNGDQRLRRSRRALRFLLPILRRRRGLDIRMTPFVSNPGRTLSALPNPVQSVGPIFIFRSGHQIFGFLVSGMMIAMV